ncbi:MAG: hypothetical protein ACI8S6_003193 [Myxococcota bacterium]|jgi:hypothetical protein
MSKQRGSRLAARLKAGIDQQLEAERLREETRKRELAAAQALRSELMVDLRSFGEAVGHFKVEPVSPEGGIRLRYGDRELTFMASGDRSEVSVGGTGVGDAASIDMEPTLRRWVLRWSRRGNRESVMLFDQGLEVLLRTAFDIAPALAAAAEAPEPEAESAEDRARRTL